VVTIFSDTAIRASDLNEAKALEAKQRAEAAMQDIECLLW
jgi:F-type H+-transporting ATPase subunit epsilon